ncbi:MAG: flagellar motor switch protein FliM [Pseudomonadota bacterium]
MGNILSQEEVDSLLQGVSGGEVETETDLPVEDADVVKYDFASQDRTVRGRMPTLEVINERFARSFRTSLSSALRKVVDVNIASTDVIKFGEFSRSLPVPTSIHVFRMEPLRGYGMFVIESRLVYSLVDSFLGGIGTSDVKIEGRDFTPIENKMIKKVIIMCLRDYESAWEHVHKVKMAVVRSEINPQFAAIVPPNDVVIVIRFDIELEQTSGNVVMCIPYSTIEPVQTKLSAGFQSDQLEVDVAWKRRLQKRIEEATVNVIARLGTAEITGRKLLGLKVGDVINLKGDIRDTLLVTIGEVPKFKGVAGVLKGSRAVKIENKIARR